MSIYNIQETAQTPEILFDLNKGELTISGKSYPENVHDTFDDLLRHIENYNQNPCNPTTINFKWQYYNTATSKMIVKILLALKKDENNLKVNWFCKPEFSMMIEKGELIKYVMELDMEIVSE